MSKALYRKHWWQVWRPWPEMDEQTLQFITVMAQERYKQDKAASDTFVAFSKGKTDFVPPIKPFQQHYDDLYQKFLRIYGRNDPGFFFRGRPTASDDEPGCNT